MTSQKNVFRVHLCYVSALHSFFLMYLFISFIWLCWVSVAATGSSLHHAGSFTAVSRLQWLQQAGCLVVAWGLGCCGAGGILVPRPRISWILRRILNCWTNREVLPHSFFLPNTVPLCRYTTSCVSMQWLIDTWLSTFWLWWIILLWTKLSWAYIFLSLSFHILVSFHSTQEWNC